MSSLPVSPTASAFFPLTRRSSSLSSAASSTSSQDTRISLSLSMSRMSTSTTDASSSCRSPPNEPTDTTLHSDDDTVTITCSTSITDIITLSPDSPDTFSGGTKCLFARRRTTASPALAQGLGLGVVSTTTTVTASESASLSLRITMPTKTALGPLVSPGGCSPSPIEPLPSPALGRLRVRRTAPGVLAAAAGSYQSASPLTAQAEFSA